MKTIKTILAGFAFFLIGLTVQAQAKKTEEIKIKTSSVCTMCKKTLEKAMAYEKGYKSAILDVDSQVLTVVYNPEKTNANNIRKAVTQTGYDADNILAVPRAYDKLEDCCKKDKAIHKD